MGIQPNSTAQRGTRFRLVAGATLLPPGHTRRHDSLRSTTYTFRCAVGTITMSRTLTCSGRLTTYAIASAMSSAVSGWNPRYTALARALRGEAACARRPDPRARPRDQNQLPLDAIHTSLRDASAGRCGVTFLRDVVA